MELKLNHRFKNDVQWGKLLDKYRSKGPSKKDIGTINTRVLGEGKYLTEKDLPENLCYAAKTNLNQNAINDVIFKKVIAETHSKDLDEPPPKFTIYIKVSQKKKKVHETFSKGCTYRW